MESASGGSGSSSGSGFLSELSLAPKVLGPSEMASASTVNVRYHKLRMLGAGTYGEAWLVRSSQSQRLYVVKELKMEVEADKEEQSRTFNEVNIIRSCCHVNIVRYKDFYLHPVSPSNPMPVLAIVMEYADKGDLSQCLKKQREEALGFFTEAQIRNWLVQVAFALQYLHKNHILHRDVKTQNIFMTSTKLLKLGDFGISKTLRHENDYATTGIGTPQYLSPEICRYQKYDYKSDIWGLGCVVYETCALVPAFRSPNLKTMVENIIRSSYKPIPSHYSVELADLIRVMLRPDPERRPSATQILSAKVLQSDVMSYMDHIRSLPSLLDNSRKGSSNSMSSTEGSNSGLSTLV